jgi:ribosomal protein S18 acetylase RimI-like enzyme/DNA-binding transcriptional ArsR family regulator
MVAPVQADRQVVELLRHPMRIRIIQAAQQPVTAADLADRLNVPVTRLYHHLDRLSEAGLVGVVGERKEKAAVSKLLQARVADVSYVGDHEILEAAMADALADARAAAPGKRLVGRTTTPIPAVALRLVIAAVEQVVASLHAATVPDGELVSFSYVVAPLRKPADPAGAHDYRLRPGNGDDVPVYKRILQEAVSWRPGVQFPATVVEHPELARFHRGWGRPGDLAVLASAGDEIVGGAFCRLFTEADHGDGFVDEQTPEVAIAVWPEHRGRGLGSRLLAALADAAGESGLACLSLSVERENPAVRLYRRSGYEIVAEPGNDYLMVRRL